MGSLLRLSIGLTCRLDEADIGMEKFFNIKCRASGLKPKCAVIVATVRALKMHGGGPPVSAGKPLQKEYTEENVELVTKGATNLCKHIENAKKFGVNVVVAVNQFKNDTEAEIEAVKKAAMGAGAYDAVLSNHWAKGGEGAADLARAVVKACGDNNEANFKFLYNVNKSIKEKVECISKEIYGADGVEYTDVANKQIDQYEKSGFGNLPICIAKTQYSFSCDASAKGVPTGFKITVREIRSCAGAGFLYPICGEIMTGREIISCSDDQIVASSLVLELLLASLITNIVFSPIGLVPGLPTRPGFFDVDVDVDTGDVLGLF